MARTAVAAKVLFVFIRKSSGVLLVEKIAIYLLVGRESGRDNTGCIIGSISRSESLQDWADHDAEDLRIAIGPRRKHRAVNRRHECFSLSARGAYQMKLAMPGAALQNGCQPR